MKVQILGSYGGDSPVCRMTSFLIDDTIAVDAGAITRALDITAQRAIRHILISHSHMDHTASLPFLIENIFGSQEGSLTIYTTESVLANVRRHLFNNDTWPDFTRIPDRLYPAVRFVEIGVERPLIIPGGSGESLEVTAVGVNHIVPTVGFLIRQGPDSVLYTSDTGPTERVWEVANSAPDLRAVITECSFPNRLKDVAEVSLHLTPDMLAAELTKLKRRVPVFLYHLKPAYLDELREELGRLETEHEVRELRQGGVYDFGAATVAPEG